MSITYIPREKSGIEQFQEGFSPYLQMAMEYMLKKQMAEQEREQMYKALTPSIPEIQTAATQKYGQPFQTMPGLPPQIAEQRIRQKAQLASQGYGQPPTATGIGTQGMTMPTVIPERLQRLMGMFKNLPSGVGATAEVAPGLSLKSKEPSLMEQMIAMQGLGGKGQGIQLVPKTIEEAKKVLIEQGENPLDYKFKSVYSTGKGGMKVQTGIEPELDTTLQNNRISNEKQTQFIKESAQDTLSTIEEIEKRMGSFGTYGQLPSIPGTARFTWEQNVNKLLSGKIVELITTMKAASKTGATGFGQLSEKEGQILKEASTALKRGLPIEDAQKILDTMKEKLQKVVGQGVIGQTQEPSLEELLAEKQRRSGGR